MRMLPPALLAVFAGFVAFAANAAATVYETTVKDPAGDAPKSSQDVRSAKVFYDNVTGSLRVTINLGSAPDSSPVQIAAGVGTLTSGTCSSPLAVLGGIRPDGPTIWLRDDDGTVPSEADGDATVSVKGSSVTLSTTTTELKGLTPNCGEVSLVDPDNVATSYDSVGPFKVSPRPTRARLAASIVGPSAVKRGGRLKLRVKVVNRGDRAASRVKVRLIGRGGNVRPANRRLGVVRPGRSRAATFSLKAGRGRSIKLTASVTGAAGVRASARKTVRITRPVKPPPSNGKGLAGQLFWGFEQYVFDRSSDILGLYFTNSKFVHWGMPEGGLKNCGRVTARVDKYGELQPGCLRYSYNSRTGRVRIGDAKGTYRRGKLKMKMDSDKWRTDGENWYSSAFAKPGTRFRLTLMNAGYFGLCGVTPSCTTYQEFITLQKDGKFGRTESSLTTGGGGSIPFVAIGSYPPEDRGRYQVLSRGRIRFFYADGKVGTETLTIQTNKRGRPDAAREGILLDDSWFYKSEDD